MTSVRIIKPISELTVSRATADVLDDNALVITSVDTHEEVERIAAPYWILARVIDEEGWVVFELINPDRPVRGLNPEQRELVGRKRAGAR